MLKFPFREDESFVLSAHVNSKIYRGLMKADDLVNSRVVVKQTDLLVSGLRNLEEEATALVVKYRQQIEHYIKRNPYFEKILTPTRRDAFAPRIINSMIEAASRSGVGPMASVAGAIAEYVGLGLLKYSPEIIVENGGDVFICSKKRREILILSESSPFFGIRIAIPGSAGPIGVCTSSGQTGHSLSYGKADAVMVVETSTTIADSAATAIANLIMRVSDIKRGIKRAQEIGVRGVLILFGEQIGAWGQFEILG